MKIGSHPRKEVRVELGLQHLHRSFSVCFFGERSHGLLQRVLSTKGVHDVGYWGRFGLYQLEAPTS